MRVVVGDVWGRPVNGLDTGLRGQGVRHERNSGVDGVEVGGTRIESRRLS